jgi:anti-sigma-K factor RskA
MEPRVTAAEIKGKKEAIPFWRRKAAISGAIAVLVIIMGVAVWQLYSRPTPIAPASVEKMTHPLPDKPSIAVTNNTVKFLNFIDFC